jgi:hypothetical protein
MKHAVNFRLLNPPGMLDAIPKYVSGIPKNIRIIFQPTEKLSASLLLMRTFR